jgi:hypothetical protein
MGLRHGQGGLRCQKRGKEADDGRLQEGVYWIDFYVDGRRKRERISPDKGLPQMMVRNWTGAQKGRDIWGFFDDVTLTAA